MFRQSRVKRLFKNDDPKLVYMVQSKGIDLTQIFKDEESDLLARAIHYHKNIIAETELTQFCDNVDQTNHLNQTYLMIAIEYDNEAMFHRLLAKGARIDIFDTNRENALFYALRSPNPVYYETLMELDIDVKGFNNEGANVALYAYKNGKKDIALSLLGMKGVFINHIDKDGNTILHYAVRQNDIPFAMKLIDLGADMFIRNYEEESPYEIAKQFGTEGILVERVTELINQLFVEGEDERIISILDDQFEVEDYTLFNIPFLIAYNAVKYENDPVFSRILRNIDLLNSLDEHGKSLLMYCIDFDRFLFAQKIMYLDVNLNLVDSEGRSVLMYLLERIMLTTNHPQVTNYIELFQELMSSHADVNVQDNDGNTVLMYALRGRQETIIDLLLNFPDTNLNLENHEGKTAAIIAYEMRDRVSLQKMIMTGNLNLNHMDKHHQTLLLMALQDNDIELFGILVNFGADLNLRYQQGKTILMIAIELNRINFIAKIFERPFNLDIRDEDGNTALMHAIMAGNVRTVKALLKLGANKRISNKAGISPIYLALDLNEMEIAKLLKTLP